jgi:hypothetical protein
MGKGFIVLEKGSPDSGHDRDWFIHSECMLGIFRDPQVNGGRGEDSFIYDEDKITHYVYRALNKEGEVIWNSSINKDSLGTANNFREFMIGIKTYLREETWKIEFGFYYDEETGPPIKKIL